MNPSIAAIMPTAPRPNCIFVSGRGSYLEDLHGNTYLDFIQGWAVNTLGHNHPALVETIQRQAQTLINPSPAFYNEPMLQLAERLTANSAFDHVFFANSGAEANEGAIKLARKWGARYKNGAHKIITFENGFHGRTLATMSASGKAGWDGLFEPKVAGFIKVPYNDSAAVAQAIDDQTVALMLEPIQGEAGVLPAAVEFIRSLRRLADDNNLLLIFDEIQTGIGRSGELFCYQHFGIEPDIMTLGKGLGGGVPLAALLSKQEFSCFEFGDQGGTYNGNPLAAAAGFAVINEVLAEGFLHRVRELGDYLIRHLQVLSNRYALGTVRGKGLLLALETRDLDATQIVTMALERHLLLNAPRPNCLRFMPALNVAPEDIDRMIEILDGILTELRVMSHEA